VTTEPDPANAGLTIANGATLLQPLIQKAIGSSATPCKNVLQDRAVGDRRLNQPLVKASQLVLSSNVNQGPDDRSFSNLGARLSDRIAAADPAFSRLRLASRAMLSLALSGVVLALVTTVHAMPVAAYGLAVVLSFIGSMAVRERAASAQLVTRLYAGCAASALAVLAGSLAPIPVAADMVFLCVIFASVYIRRFGQRWFAVGMVAFMAYFMGDYLRAQPAQVGWIVFGAATALASTQFVTTVLLPDDPERDFRRAMTTIDHRINLVLRHLLRMADGLAVPKDDVEALRTHLSRLRDIILMAEGFIPQDKSGLLAAKGASSDLATALFDLQLAVERLARVRNVALPDPSMVRALLDERGCLLRSTEPEGPTEEQSDIAARLLLRLRDARVRINTALGTTPSPAFQDVLEEASDQDIDVAASAADDASAKPAQPLVPEALQRPIQVTLACALALGTGLLVSPTRWYWAVITAFIVFNNTRSRADTAMRALQRSAGTLGGLFAGTALATILQGHIVASGIGIPVLFFLAFYFLQTSYGLMIFFVTIALALLYGLMGMFTPQLLLLRLEETVVGGLSGALVAFLVFPVSTTAGLQSAVAAFMDALNDLLAAASNCVHGQDDAGDLARLSRNLDRRYADLATAARPVAGPFRVVTRFGPVRRRLLLFVACAHWGRVLAQTLAAAVPLPEAEVRSFDKLALETGEQIQTARMAGAELFLRRANRGVDPKAASTALPVATETEKAAQILEALRDLMKRLNNQDGDESTATRNAAHPTSK
jgi:uncharacterized membrane protein YccC